MRVLGAALAALLWLVSPALAQETPHRGGTLTFAISAETAMATPTNSTLPSATRASHLRSTGQGYPVPGTAAGFSGSCRRTVRPGRTRPGRP